MSIRRSDQPIMKTNGLLAVIVLNFILSYFCKHFVALEGSQYEMPHVSDGQLTRNRVMKICGIPSTYEIVLGDCSSSFTPLGHRLLPMHIIQRSKGLFMGAVVANSCLASDPDVYRLDQALDQSGT